MAWHSIRILPTPEFYYLSRPLEDSWKMWPPFYFCIAIWIFILYAYCNCAQRACVYVLNVYDVHAWGWKCVIVTTTVHKPALPFLTLRWGVVYSLYFQYLGNPRDRGMGKSIAVYYISHLIAYHGSVSPILLKLKFWYRLFSPEGIAISNYIWPLWIAISFLVTWTSNLRDQWQ